MGFFALALYRLDWALLLIVSALPAYLIRFKLGPLPLTLLEAMILLAAFVWLAKDFWPNNRSWLMLGGKRPADRLRYPYAWQMIAILVISLFAVWVANLSLGALGIWKAYFFEPILLFILLINTFKQRSDMRRLALALAFSATAVALLAVYQQLTGRLISNPFWAAEETRRVTSFFGYPNAVGLYLAPISSLLLGALLSEKRCLSVGKIIFGGALFLSWLAIYFAKSEGALVALAASLAFLGLVYSRRSRLATLIIVGLTVSSLFMLDSWRGWVSDKIFLRDLSGEIRKQQWRETIEMLQDGRLVSGSGLDNYQASIAPYHQEGIFYNSDNLPNFHSIVWASSTLQKKYWQPVEIYKYPHNIVLNFWTEIGLAGLLIFVWLIARGLWLNWQAVANRAAEDLRPFSIGVIMALISILVHGLVDVPYFKNDLAALFWIVLAIGSLAHLQLTAERIRK